MRKILIPAIAVGALIAVAAVAPVVASGGHIDRCRGVVQTQVVHPAGHKARTVHVCVPATKRLDLAVGLGTTPPPGFTVSFSFATTTPGPIAQFYDTLDGNVLGVAVTRHGVVFGAGSQSFGGGPGADGKVHRVEVDVNAGGTGTLYVDGKRIDGGGAWAGDMPTMLHVAIGGLDHVQFSLGVEGQTTYTGSVAKLQVLPTAKPDVG